MRLILQEFMNIRTKRRFADARQNEAIIKKNFKNITINEENFVGNVSLLNIIEVTTKCCVDDEQRCILDNNYKWIEIYPSNKNYCITTMYNDKNEIVEYYVDICLYSGIENDVPYEDDLYLDVVFVPDGRIHLLDEDELEDAYKKGIISMEEFDLAYKVANDLIESTNLEDLKSFCNKYLKLLSENN